MTTVKQQLDQFLTRPNTQLVEYGTSANHLMMIIYLTDSSFRFAHEGQEGMNSQVSNIKAYELSLGSSILQRSVDIQSCNVCDLSKVTV